MSTEQAVTLFLDSIYPLLFLIIFNDLTDVIKHSKVIKYADDTVLYVSAKSATEISNKLTDDLTTLSKWFDDN